MKPNYARLTCALLLLSAAGGFAGLPAHAQNAPAGKKSTKAKSGGDKDTGDKADPSSVKYTDLRDHKVSLPYGEPFLITGDTGDVQFAGGTLKDLMTATSVSGTYTDSDGTGGNISASPVKGTAWRARIGKLAADTSATFVFQFAGSLTDNAETLALKEMLDDPAYRKARAAFQRESDRAKDSAETMAAAAQMASAAADALIAAMGRSGLAPQDPAALRTNLSAAILTKFEPIYNVESKYAIVLDLAKDLAPILGKDPASVAKMSRAELYTALKTKDISSLNADYQTAVRQFLRTYEDAATAFVVLKEAAFTASSSLAVGEDSESDIVSDLKKYAGFDVGALYAPRLGELRTFAMVNIYWGAVQLKPDAKPSRPGFWPVFQQRVSLSFGAALKDVSGASKSKISSQYAFVYGVGFRLNKYFRLNAGGMVYRTTLPAVNGVTSPADGSLRHEFFFGPSIDVTALSALQSIFAKGKSN